MSEFLHCFVFTAACVGVFAAIVVGLESAAQERRVSLALSGVVFCIGVAGVHALWGFWS